MKDPPYVVPQFQFCEKTQGHAYVVKHEFDVFSFNKVWFFFLLFLGDPMPQVTWWRDSHLIDSSFEKTFGHTVQNTLSVPQVSREDLGATLTCQASNNNISAPASARVAIDLKCEKNFPILQNWSFWKLKKIVEGVVYEVGYFL